MQEIIIQIAAAVNTMLNLSNINFGFSYILILLFAMFGVIVLQARTIVRQKRVIREQAEYIRELEGRTPRGFLRKVKSKIIGLVQGFSVPDLSGLTGQVKSRIKDMAGMDTVSSEPEPTTRWARKPYPNAGTSTAGASSKSKSGSQDTDFSDFFGGL